MYQPSKPRKFSIFWAPLIILAIILVLGSAFIIFSNLYNTHEEPGFSGLVPQAVQADTSASQATDVSVWVDTGPSMYGFLNSGRSICVPSSYKMVLESLPDIAKQYSQVASITYYHFDSTFSGSSDTDAQRRLVRADHQTGALQLLSENTYQTLPESGGASTALLSVLDAIDLENPTIILTDFEADGLTQQPAEYAKPLERIFGAGYCVSVVAMKSAFTGILYNYTNESVNYVYGTSKCPKNATQLIDNYPNHHQPRPFYAIIIGTSRQCEQLSAAVQNTYQSMCKTNITDKIEEISKADGRKERAENFVALQSADFWLNDTFDIVTAADNVSVSVSGGAQAVSAEDSPWEASGVPEFTLTVGSNGEAQSAVITFHVVPASACYKTTYATDTYAAPVPQTQKVIKTSLGNSELPESETVLLARGGRRVQLSITDFTDQHQWFECSAVSADANGLSFRLQVDLSNCSPGMYRLVLPVYCRHSTETEDQNGAAWSRNWSISTGRLRDAVESDGNTPRKTVDLYEQLEAIRRAEVSQCSREDHLVAQLTVDLNIQ